jgi:hypothetical protein
MGQVFIFKDGSKNIVTIGKEHAAAGYKRLLKHVTGKSNLFCSNLFTT